MSVVCVFVSFLEISWLVFSEWFDLKKEKRKKKEKKAKISFEWGRMTTACWCVYSFSVHYRVNV